VENRALETDGEGGKETTEDDRGEEKRGQKREMCPTQVCTLQRAVRALGT
jgi:hypothetical protein